MSRRSSLAMLALVLLVGPAILAVPPAAHGAAGAVPRPGDPVLRPDSAWVATDWGFVKKGFRFDDSRPWPTVFIMDGYSGAGEPNAYVRMDDGTLIAIDVRFGEGPEHAFARVYASIRGTECSGGEFYLYDRRHAWDGHHLVEWIASEAWSNGKVGMIGWSYSGQTAFWVASTRPPHLAAVSANLLHSDVYRDIFMVGGVQNNLFPVVWAYGLGVVSGPHRVPVSSIEDQVVARDEICAHHQATRTSPTSPPQIQLEPAWAAISSTDNDWYASHAAANYAPLIRVPYYQQNDWQDEQTGPRAAVLWHHVHPDPVKVVGVDGRERTVVPKVMRTSNGDHGWGEWASRDMWAWFDVWLRGRADVRGILDAPVVNYFEASHDGSTFSAKKSGASWPFPDTRWVRWHARDGGALSREAPTGDEPADRFVSGVPRDGNWFFHANGAGNGAMAVDDTPTAVAYATPPLRETLTIAGPILFTMSAALSGTDADLFVSLADVQPDGNVSFLQRGLLKASHRAIDSTRSYYARDGTLVQPYRPHTNPQPLVPGEVTELAIEVWPVGHVFRPGHRVLVQVHTPPVVDGLWGYTATQHQPGVVTVHHSRDRPTTLLLPVVTPDAPPAPGATCPVPGGFPCVARLAVGT